MSKYDWDTLKQRGDWLFIPGITAQHAQHLVAKYLLKWYGPEAKAICCTVDGGAFVSLAKMPKGGLEEAEAKRTKLRMDQQERLEDMKIGKVIDLMEAHKADQPLINDDDEDPWADLEEGESASMPED